MLDNSRNAYNSIDTTTNQKGDHKTRTTNETNTNNKIHMNRTIAANTKIGDSLMYATNKYTAGHAHDHDE